MAKNVVSLARTVNMFGLLAKTFGLLILLSIINQANGQAPTVSELKEVLSDGPRLDRSNVNAREDGDSAPPRMRRARRKLIIAALWTDARLAYPTLDALGEGLEVHPGRGWIGGTSEEAHRAGLRRLEAAGDQPVNWVSVATEMQRATGHEPTPWSTSARSRSSTGR